jgi:hypothetical protein
MEPKLRFRQFFPFRNQCDGAEEGFELIHHVENAQLNDCPFGLTAQNAAQSRLHCTFIVRRTHCGRENRAKVFSLKPASNSLTSAPSVGQAVKPLFATDPGCLEWRRARSRLKISSPLRCAAMSWLDRLLNGMVRRLFQPAARYKRFVDPILGECVLSEENWEVLAWLFPTGWQQMAW